MRILYGVVGEGMGHAMRSRVVLDELVKHHDVQVVVSGRAYDYLKQRASESLAVKKIWGYSIVYEDNEVQNFKTLLANVKGAVKGWPQNVRAYFELAEKFQPDVVISDFESWSYLFGKNHLLPVLSLDNMQIIDRCTHSPEILDGLGADFQLTKALVKAKVAGAAHYYITTFFYPPTRKPDTSLHPPILRPEILAARPGPGEHLLVYQTSTSNAALPEILARSGLECRIYGLRRDLTDGRARGETSLSSVQRGRLHRRSPDSARGGRQRRVHAHGRGGLPAATDAGDPGQKAARAGAERALPRGGGLRSRRPRRSRTSGWARSSSGCPTSNASSPATGKTGTSTCSLRSNKGSRRRRPARIERQPDTTKTAPTSWTSEPFFESR